MSGGEQTECPVCGGDNCEDISSREDWACDNNTFNCARCGQFSATRTFSSIQSFRQSPGKEDRRRRANLSAWLREKTDQRAKRGGRIITLDSGFLDLERPNDIRDALEAAGTPRFHEKADKLLLAIEAHTDFAGEYVGFMVDSQDRLEWLARAWALNDKELYEICRYLEQEGRIEGETSASSVSLRLLPAGWARIEELTSTPQASPQGFVAMWFDEVMTPVYEQAFAPAIREAGYSPLRIDGKPSDERIDDRIEAEIKKSKFVIADATGHRGGVYYEAGFARGLGIPVIWTCREDEFEKLHFDIRQFNCFKWSEDNYEGLINDLRWRIENICGRGPVKHKEAN